MDALTAPEIAGVLGHEMSHILHRDILVGTIAAVMAGTISALTRFAFWFGGGRDRDRQNPIASLLILILTPLMAMIIQLAISRTREYMADEAGGALCGDPDELANALEKIDLAAHRTIMAGAQESSAHMFTISPFAGKEAKSLFSTHPATEDRIRRLREQAERMGTRQCIV